MLSFLFFSVMLLFFFIFSSGTFLFTLSFLPKTERLLALFWEELRSFANSQGTMALWCDRECSWYICFLWLHVGSDCCF